MKQEPGEHMVIMGSGSIVTQLAVKSLVDEYQMVVEPHRSGARAGRCLRDLTEKLPLKRTNVRAFGNGNVLLCYQPMP